MDIKASIKTFLQKRVGNDKVIADQEDIFQSGMVNSLFALELVTFLEGEFKITVENEDLDLQNFNSLNNMEAFVQRKRK